MLNIFKKDPVLTRSCYKLSHLAGVATVIASWTTGGLAISGVIGLGFKAAFAVFACSVLFSPIIGAIGGTATLFATLGIGLAVYKLNNKLKNLSEKFSENTDNMNYAEHLYNFQNIPHSTHEQNPTHTAKSEFINRQI